MAETSNDIILPIIPDVQVNKGKDSFNELEKQLLKSVGKPLNVIDSKIIDIRKNLRLAFVQVGDEFAKITYSLTKKGNLRKNFSIETLGSDLALFTREEARRLTNTASAQSLDFTTRQIKKERREQATEDIKTAKKNIKNREKELEIQKEIEKRQRSVEFASVWNNAIGNNLSPLERNKLRQDALKSELNELEKLAEEYYLMGEEGKESFDEILPRATKLRDEISKLKEEQKELSRKSPLQRLVDTFKRVGFYRIARGAFAMIGQNLSQSLSFLAQFDSGANKTLSSLTSQITILSNSFSVMLLPILQLVEPIVKSLTTFIANLASAFSYLAFQLGITSSWFQINTDYMKDFANQSNNLSFDKFESLNQQDDVGSMFEESTSNELTPEMQNTVDLLKEILIIIGSIASIKLVTWIIDGSGLKFFESLGSKLTKIFKKFSELNSINVIGNSILGIIISIVNLINVIQNWDSSSLVTKITAITSAVFALASIIFAIIAATGVGGAGVVKVFKGVSAGLTAGSILLAGVSAMKFANGGMVDTGSLFVAGEAGAEFVTTMPSGKTGVTNITQFKQAMVEALYECSDIFQNNNPEVVLNLDGAKIARSKRFIGEVNRKNAGLNLR